MEDRNRRGAFFGGPFSVRSFIEFIEAREARTLIQEKAVIAHAEKFHTHAARATVGSRSNGRLPYHCSLVRIAGVAAATVPCNACWKERQS